MPGQRKQINSIAKFLICNVYKHFKSQQNKSKYPSGSISKKTIEVIGFSRSAVCCMYIIYLYYIYIMS